jgi:hypothetical protein
MEVSGQLHAPAALPQGKSPRYPLDRLGGPQSRSGRDGSSSLLGINILLGILNETPCGDRGIRIVPP